MIAEIIFVSAALAGALVGSVTDIYSRIIYNWVTYSMIALGLGGHLLLSLLEKSPWPVLYSLAGAGAFFAAAMLMFYSGAWGGGDTKLLVGFGALLPAYPAPLLAWLSPELAIWPFMLTVFINILLFGAVMALGFGAYVIIRNWRKFIKDLGGVMSSHRMLVHALTATAVIPIALYLLAIRVWLAAGIAWSVCVIFAYIFLLMKSVENISMYRLVSPGKLMEGDWIVEKVFAGKKLAYCPEKTGIVQRDIDRLVKLRVKSVKVKEGLPMIPAFLAGLIASLAVGDLLFMFLSALL